MTGHEKTLIIFEKKNIDGGVWLFPQAGRMRDPQPAGGTHAGLSYYFAYVEMKL